MNNPYQNFTTNQSEEQTGVFVNYGEFRVRVARAGGTNKQFNLALDRKARAMRRAGNPSVAQTKLMMQQLIAETCVKAWETKVEGQWASGLAHPQTGELMPFSVEAVKQVFEAIPDLAEAIQAEANSLELFQQGDLAEEQGN